MRRYPMLVSLAGRTCLVVGAGRVGLRKIRSLALCGPKRLLVLERGAPRPELQELAALPGVVVEQRDFVDADLDGVFLVIAATSDGGLNRRVGELAQSRGILCNVADAPELCSFIVPSSVERGELTIAVSTGGGSPALAKVIRKDLQERYGEEYAQFLRLMARLRPLVLAKGQETPENSELFRALTASALLIALRGRDADLARAELARLLPKDLHSHIPELLHELA